MQAAAGAGRTGGGGDAGTRGSGSSVLQGAEPRPPVLPDAAAATSPGDTSATGRHGAGGRAVGCWGGGSESPGSGWRATAAAGPFPAPLRPAPGVRGAEPTRRARGPAAPAATATAVESCDDQAAARAPAAALAQPQPLPCRPSTVSSRDRDLRRKTQPGLVGTWRGGWGRCELVAGQVLGAVTWPQAAGRSQKREG